MLRMGSLTHVPPVRVRAIGQEKGPQTLGESRFTASVRTHPGRKRGSVIRLSSRAVTNSLLFLSSFALLFLALAFRFHGTPLRATCAALFFLGVLAFTCGPDTQYATTFNFCHYNWSIRGECRAFPQVARR
jgi:hypothetical protein